MGIGLSIVRSLVELHGGTARAESEGQGRGARFIVELPTIAPPPQAEAAASLALTGAAGPGGRRQRRRSRDGRHLSGHARLLGGNLCDRRGGSRLAWPERPSVILVDIGLPGIDGYQFLRGARLLAGCASIPALAGDRSGRAG